MMPLTKVLAGALSAAAVIGSAPAAAQYYPQSSGSYYPYGSGTAPTMGNAPGYGYGYGGYDGSQGPMVSQCTAAVQARLNGNGGYGGGYYGGGGYATGGGQVLGISRVDPRSDGGFTVRGVAASGAYGYGSNQQPDLTFRCRTDFRGMVTEVTIQPAQRTYNPYGATSPYGSGPYGYANPYGQGPYAPPADSQGPYYQGQDDQGPYYQDQNNNGPYGYYRY